MKTIYKFLFFFSAALCMIMGLQASQYDPRLAHPGISGQASQGMYILQTRLSNQIQSVKFIVKH